MNDFDSLNRDQKRVLNPKESLNYRMVYVGRHKGDPFQADKTTVTVLQTDLFFFFFTFKFTFQDCV